MRNHEAIAAQRFIRAFADRDLETLETAGEENFRPVTAAMAACFTALVRMRVPPTQVARVAAETVLLDSEENKIPTWVVEAALRGALDEPGMLAGVPPGLLIDTHLAYLAATDIPAAERDHLVLAADALLDESRDDAPEPL